MILEMFQAPRIAVGVGLHLGALFRVMQEDATSR